MVRISSGSCCSQAVLYTSSTAISVVLLSWDCAGRQNHQPVRPTAMAKASVGAAHRTIDIRMPHRLTARTSAARGFPRVGDMPGLDGFSVQTGYTPDRIDRQHR